VTLPARNQPIVGLVPAQQENTMYVRKFVVSAVMAGQLVQSSPAQSPGPVKAAVIDKPAAVSR